MNLLILTQKVDKNDPDFFFFYKWIEEFSKQCEKVTVICLYEGEHDFPINVQVLTLGKEKNASRLHYVFKFYTYIWKQRKNYDHVFVHMNPEYVVMGGLVWKMLGKKNSLWYTHRQVNLKLKIAEKLSNVIFTASSEGFGVPSKKVHIMGHGIDTESLAVLQNDYPESFVGMHIGRVTKIKHIDIILRGIQKLIQSGAPITSFLIVGAPSTEEDKQYMQFLKSLVRELGLEDIVQFKGKMKNIEALREASFTINATPDGGMDKVVFESLVAGRPVFTSNNAFYSVFEDNADEFIFDFNDPEDLKEKIEIFFKGKNQKEIIERLSEKVKNEYSTESLIEHILRLI